MFSENEMLQNSAIYYNSMQLRRSIRFFSSQKVNRAIIENCIKTAGTAPSGANKQPWTFCVVQDSEIKHKIRVAAEEEEKKSYADRMSDTWLHDLAPMATDASKPFLEKAPFLIIVFKQLFTYANDGKKHQNYYVNESVGIAVGLLISAIHNAGLVTLTHTPSPMRFLEKILDRPDNERAYLVLPVGYPENECFVPDLKRKNLNEIAVFY